MRINPVIRFKARVSFDAAICILLSLILSIPLCTLASPSLSGQNNSPSHTAKDFMDARDSAEKAMDGVRSILRQHATLRSAAEDAATKIKQETTSRASGATAVKVLSDEDALLLSVINAKVLDSLTPIADSSKDSLGIAKDNLTKAKQKLDDLKNDSPDFAQVLTADQQTLVSQSLAECQVVLDQANKDEGLNKDSSKKLTDVLPSIIAQATEVVAAFNGDLQSLSDLADAKTPDANRVLKDSGKCLPGFATTVDARGDYKKAWNKVAADLKTALSSTDSSPVDKKLAELDNTISKISKALPSWLDTVKQLPASETDVLEKSITSVDKDAPANSASAQGELKKASPVRDSVQGVVDAWTKINVILDKLGSDAAPLTSDTVKADLEEFTNNSHALYGALSRLQEAIAGDFSNFEADQQPLFYFTDVPRLIRMLNPGAYQVGGIRGAQEQAAAQRQKLAQAELDLAAAQADVNTYQTQLMQLPEQLKQARQEARRQDSAYAKTSSRLSILTDRLSTVTSQVGTLSGTPATGSAASKLDNQNALLQAQKEKDRLNSQTADAQNDNANALHDKDVSDQKLKALEDTQTGIPAQVEKAQLALQAAQKNVSQRRQESLLAAQAESDAFALSRDNTPYWYAPASGISKDVARRVEMYGTDDSKIIYLRGKRADLDAVKDIIAGIDQPSPQARVTLWSLQLNYTSDTKGNGAKQLNDALFRVEDQLSEIRSRMAISVSLLRDSVNAQVNEVVKSECTSRITAEDCRLVRLRKFYNRQVLLELGDMVDPTNAGSPDPFKEISRLTVPDPSGTTTLGEALLILSLAKPTVRQEVLGKFQSRINNAKGKWDTWYSSKDFGKTDRKYLVAPEFTRLKRALSMDSDPAGDEPSELTSSQLEVVRAVRSAAYVQTAKRIASLGEQLHARNDSLVSACTKIRAIDRVLANSAQVPVPCHLVSGPEGLALVTAAQGDLQTRRSDLLNEAYAEFAAANGLNNRMVPLLLFCWQHFGVAPESFGSLSKKDLSSALQHIPGNKNGESDLYSATKLSALLASHPLREATAREAAADEMLKELMTAMEEDLDRIFVRPGLANLREDLANQSHLQVGILQRTSMLASNRLQARVDPRSSAQLALGEEQDIVQSVTQLGQIYLAAQTGGALGTLQALNNLKQQTKEPPQEIYGITTGSTFKITPIFDPSGQALRFKFDFVAANNITEPNGTTNPQLPRIERHTVNTEVQISNHEVREISRYEANSKIGLPTKYWGGIPIFKDILEEFPTVRPYVPIFGWFVRKAGSGAASQESLLFGQTTIYPTIGDIVQLLTGDVQLH